MSEQTPEPLTADATSAPTPEPPVAPTAPPEFRPDPAIIDMVTKNEDPTGLEDR